MNQQQPEKKRMNIVLYTLIMLAIFLFVTEFIIYGYGGSLLYDSISNYPQGKLVISETILAVMVLIVMLLFKNSYVFTQKKESLKTGLFYGLFYLIGIVFFTFLFGILSGAFFSGLGLINVFIGAILVGVCEEFLCRGWLLNEFLERYGDTKKGVWYSIIISGVIFGLIHLGNFFNGQDLVSTVTQILSASATGIVFGLIYYKTKNIWSVILLHGLWDFSLFLGDLAPITEATEVFNSFSVLGIVFSILMIASELVMLIPHIKDIDAKPSTTSVIVCSTLSFAFFFFFTLMNGAFSMEMGGTYKYEDITLERYATTKDNYRSYLLEHENIRIDSYVDSMGNLVSQKHQDKFEIEVSINDDKNIILTNKNTKDKVEIEVDDLIDFIVLEADDYYVIAYEDYQGKNNSFLYYIYVNKSDLSNEEGYLKSLKDGFKKYLLPERLSLLIISDYEKNKDYVTAYDVDYGYYLLIEDGKMAKLK